ncbi:MAG: RNase adapter RapZ [Gammaproteobacteria bacterium]|nr:RNase adapter RapZ [Gammaproteobacteria bacterium]
MKLLIISGMSGSGKSVALNVLEDIGYLCIDNLPLGLLPSFAKQLGTETYADVDKVAIGIDIRNRGEDLAQFPQLLDSLNMMGLECQTFFLNAKHDILIKRFSETRRKHPLSSEQLPLNEAIEQEFLLLDPVISHADLQIDTSYTTLHQLRRQIIERVNALTHHNMSIQLLSFGFKHGIPTDADFVFDVRCLPNPHWIPELQSLTGRDKGIVDYLSKSDSVNQMQEQLGQFIHNWIPEFKADNRSYLTIAIGCTGGQHRSVYMVEQLGKQLQAQHSDLMIRHRELA